MALNKDTLQTNLYNLFLLMIDDTSRTIKDFADDFSTVIKDYVSQGSVSTTDSGDIVGGSFSGSGNGTITVTITDCSQIIEDACNEMMENTRDEDFIAQKIGEAIQKMADEAVINTNVSGELTTPSGVTSTVAGVAVGTIDCDSDDLINSLKLTFKEMWDKKEVTGYDGNLEFAKTMATKTHSFWTSGDVSTKGLVNLKGSSGSGSLS